MSKLTISVSRYLIFAVPSVAIGLTACEGCRSTPSARTAASGAEEGRPTARLYLVSDLAGALEPCGCTKDQLGGLDHFGSWVTASHAVAPAALVASAGPLLFMDDKLEGDRADQDRLKAETIARVLHGLDFAAFAPGRNDWDDGAQGLNKLAVLAGAGRITNAGSVVVREVNGLKVGLVGFGQDLPLQDATSAAIEQAVKTGVEEAKRQGANVLVALAAVGRGEAKRIADAVPELTAVVVGSAKSNGDANTTAPQGEQVGNVLIAQSANHLQSVAVLDLYVRETIGPGKVVKFADATGLERASKREDLSKRIDDLHVKIAAWDKDGGVAASDLEARRQELGQLEAELEALDHKPPPAQGSFFRYSLKEIRDSLGKAPTIEGVLGDYYKAVNEHNRVLFADRSPPPASPRQPTYIGVEACTECHREARKVYDRTSHSHAYATLVSQYKQFNLECVSCHVTGYERPGGSTVTHVETLKDVQCEVCHGPGSRHVQDPEDATWIIAKPPAAMCRECHHSPHVESFNAVAKMKEILGPGHGMPVR